MRSLCALLARTRGRRPAGALVGIMGGALLSVALPLAAQPSSPDQIVAAALRDWPPQYTLDEAGEPDGFGIEIFEAIARRAGLNVRYRLYDSFPEVLAALESGEVDAVPNCGITETRRQRFAFSQPVETFSIVLFVRREELGVEGLESLTGHRLGAVESNAALRILRDRHLGPIEVHSDVRRALFDLLAGRIDGLAYPRPVVESLARRAGVEDRLRIAGPPLAEIKRAVAVQRDDTALLARLEPAVRDLLGSDEYRTIYTRWYGKPAPFWTVPRVAWAMGLLLVGSLLAMGVWRHVGLLRLNRRLRSSIAERERTEGALREERARAQAITENLTEGLMISDLEGRIEYVNPQMARMLRRDDLVGSPVEEILGEGEDPESVRNRLERRQEGIEERYRVRLRTADGESRWFEVNATPFRDAEGRIVGALAALTDVTERLWAEEELRKKELQLAEAQRLEAIGRLAGGVAHDFNNILTAILGYGELLLKQLDPGDPRREDLEQIQEAAERAAILTQQLLAFGRKQVLQPRPLDLNDSVREMTQMLERLITGPVDITTDLASPLDPIFADGGQVGQVILNLVLNARDAMPGGGTIEIETGNLFVTPPRAATLEGVRPGPHVFLEVRDRGPGIDEEILAHIFEPFFTTKAQGEGSGLGLSTVYGIVRQSGGGIEVDTTPGEGSTFRLLFPRAPTAAPAEEATLAEQATSSVTGARQANVLVVDDEESVRRLAARFLEQAGYRVVTARDGLEAVDRVGQEAFDVVVTDLVMPGIDGAELADRLARLHPDTKVLTISAFSNITGDAEAPFLSKPFTSSELVDRVDGLLAGSGRPPQS